MTSPLRILYVEGFARSGSTILDNVVGQVDGFFSVGELRFVWDRNLRDDRVCGCGRPFSGCPVWTRILRRAYGDAPPDPARVLSWREAAMPLRATPLTLLPGAAERLRTRYRPYLETLRRLYTAVAEETGARVVVDSSKYPSYGYLLGLVPGLDVSVVHLVRDPRAVAYSWTRRKMEVRAHGQIRPMGESAPLRTARDWMLWMALCDVYGKASQRAPLRLRYEDFVGDPVTALAAILQHVGESGRPLPFLSGHRVTLAGNHTVGGNPGRLRAGPVDLRLDDEWMRALPARQRATVSAVCWPALRRYGYPISIPSPAEVRA